MRSERSDLGSKRPDFWSDRPDLGSKNIVLGSEAWEKEEVDWNLKKVAQCDIIGHLPFRGRCTKRKEGE